MNLTTGGPTLSFERLTPDTILGAIETAIGLPLTNLVNPLPSYINRVYELRAKDGTKLIVKFYRPGRWSREAIQDEHDFIGNCSEAELPVVAPLPIGASGTLAEYDGFLFALFPKCAGRQLEIIDETIWARLGSLVARMHNAGRKRPAAHRITLDPQLSMLSDVEELCGGIIPPRMAETFRATATQLIRAAAPLFEGRERFRIHGDCHRGNILDRLDQGLLLIDFDDMAMGPPVQDLWLLLPDRPGKAAREIELFISGYERFCAFDRSSLRLIEPLRAMRMVYFLAWCGRQRDDYVFKRNFPDFGSEVFWQREINDLREQMGFVLDAPDTIGNY
ncbi:MAG: serine/threonine protein kinase [Chitinivibrionales bacterium]|nr:serine/threonine protein kinase [Chitinivibrionales bacterium]